MRLIVPVIIFSVFHNLMSAQDRQVPSSGGLLDKGDLEFLRELTRDVVESSRIYPGQVISPDFGPNNTGGTLIRPGGKDCYPAFWIRDYAMSLESGFVSDEEQRHMLLLTAATQCDKTRITRGGSMIPYGAIADHIRIDDSLPIFFPGTYNFEDQGNKNWGMVPPYCDQFFFIHMAHYYVRTTTDTGILMKEINGKLLIDRLETAFNVPPSGKENHIVYTTDDFRGVDFGFRDVITITGYLCMPSVLKFRAAKQLANLFGIIKNNEKAERYRTIAETIKNNLPGLFLEKRGMLCASTGKSSQPDVWSTALAVYYKILEGENRIKACRFLADAYEKGFLAYHGNIRHILTCDDFNEKTAWEFSLAEKNTYQNGAYWGTPTGWVCHAIAQADSALARRLAGEYLDDLRRNDYRKGGEYGAPYECFHPSGHKQNPVYMTTVSCPYMVFRFTSSE